jgi:hypothetical protein
MEKGPLKTLIVIRALVRFAQADLNSYFVGELVVTSNIRVLLVDDYLHA